MLSDVLSLLRLRSEVLCWSELAAPWGLSFDPDDALFFHVVARGACVLRINGADEWFEARAGDLLVLPEGRGHRLLSSRTSHAAPVMSLVDPRGRIPGRLRHGGSGAETQVLCGRFRFDEGLRLASLPGLPSVLHIRGERGGPPEWLDLTIRLLAAEAKSDAPGREIAMSRLVDLLFVQAVRHWIRNDPNETPLGWIGAGRDPRVAAAITLMHRRPEHPWDVRALAEQVGMSRSKFAERFAELVGEPPSRYLTRWRMLYASRLLQVPEMNVTLVAARVGYESESAFSRAFKRAMGVGPFAFARGETNR